eukprot:763420-Hanusia_phi.AAC.2
MRRRARRGECQRRRRGEGEEERTNRGGRTEGAEGDEEGRRITAAELTSSHPVPAPPLCLSALSPQQSLPPLVLESIPLHSLRLRVLPRSLITTPSLAGARAPSLCRVPQDLVINLIFLSSRGPGPSHCHLTSPGESLRHGPGQPGIRESIRENTHEYPGVSGDAWGACLWCWRWWRRWRRQARRRGAR